MNSLILKLRCWHGGRGGGASTKVLNVYRVGGWAGDLKTQKYKGYLCTQIFIKKAENLPIFVDCSVNASTTTTADVNKL